MKATFVLLANIEAENLGKRILLDAHKIGGVGFESSRLPLHVSLKQPFTINSLEEIEGYFDEMVKKLHPFTIRLTDLDVIPSDVFGIASGLLWLNVEETSALREAHNMLNCELEQRFGCCEADYDGERYHFHMTIAIGGKPFQIYEETYRQLIKIYDQTHVFHEIALLYYDDEAIKPGTYFCYKRAKLQDEDLHK